MKILNIILAVMFLAFAFVQINDPDPIHWILIYLSMVVICVMAVFNKYSRIANIVLMIVFLGYSTTMISGIMEWLAQENKSALFDDVAKMEHLYIEESREFLGLMICVAVLIMQLIRSRKSK